MTELDVTQILLPGRAAAPAGPIPMIGTYVMHHPFRRDLELAVRAERCNG